MPYENGPSNFESFDSDYDKINWLDTNTWTKKKVYDSNYWLILPNQKHNMKLGNDRPYLTVYLRKSGEQFGDAITPPEFENYTITFRCFDSDGIIAVVGPATKTNIHGGEIQYQFSALDFTKEGVYYGEFEFKLDVSEGVFSTFVLPDTRARLPIIVIK